MRQGISLQKVVAHSKAYGFIYNSSEIYEGLQSVYDYGPYGVLLKRRIQEFWWRTMVDLHTNIVGLDAAILMAPSTWEASGHVAGFHDWLVDHKESKKRYRVDVLLEEHAAKLTKGGNKEGADALLSRMGALMKCGDGAALTQMLVEHNVVCPVAHTANWTVAREFNLMLATQLGSVKGASNNVYLRPETAQGIFVNFLNVQKTARMKVPFGIAQIGKAFRNEIVARQFVFRMREFEQMEMQFFVHPDEAPSWFAYWAKLRKAWYSVMGVTDVRVKEHEQLAHYAAAALDIEYAFPFGYKEVEGIHNRGDFDLTNHARLSKKNLRYFDARRNAHYTPHVIETSAGCDRLVLMLLCQALREESSEATVRTYLSFPPALAPIQVAILPLVKKDALIAEAERIFLLLRCYFSVFYDDRGSIGKRYTRQDLLGTPYCITIDFDTLKDRQVTIRHRDSMEQERVSMDTLCDFLMQRVGMPHLLHKVSAMLAAFM